MILVAHFDKIDGEPVDLSYKISLNKYKELQPQLDHLKQDWYLLFLNQENKIKPAFRVDTTQAAIDAIKDSLPEPGMDPIFDMEDL